MEDHVCWAIESMAPFKTSGKNGILPVLIQQRLQSLLCPVCRICQASLTWLYSHNIEFHFCLSLARMTTLLHSLSAYQLNIFPS